MSIQPGASVYTQGFASRPENVEVPHVDVRAPAATDTNYPVGKRWIFQNNSAYDLLGLSTLNGVTSATWAAASGGTTDLSTLTGNSGGAISPIAGNINIVGSNTTSVSGAGNTLTINATAAGYPTTPFVVGPSGSAGYQTIQSAVTAANAAGGGIIVVQPGTYTENLTLSSLCHIMGLDFADAGGGVTIIGTHTPPTSGGFVFNNVALQSATNILSSSAAGTAHLVIANSIITVTNGYTFNLLNWTGKLESFDVNAAVGTNDGYVNNTGGSTVAIFDSSVGSGTSNVMTVSGSVLASGSDVYCPINFVTGASAEFDACYLLGALTLSNNSTGTITTSHIATGSSAAITMSSSGAWKIYTSIIDSTNNPAIAGSGAGTLTIGAVTFANNSTIANTLTLAWAALKTGALSVIGTTTINTTGAAVTSIGTGGTGATNIGNATGNTAVTGSLTASTSLTATLGAITATNGNLVFGTAGNKIISTSVASTTTAGANSFGTVTLATGTATVSTTAVTANSIIMLTRQSPGATGANPLGMLSVGTIVGGTSFVINALTTANSTTNVSTDVSVVGWMIIN